MLGGERLEGGEIGADARRPCFGVLAPAVEPGQTAPGQSSARWPLVDQGRSPNSGQHRHSDGEGLELRQDGHELLGIGPPAGQPQPLPAARTDQAAGN